jgi:hypothetical protein
VIADLFDLRAPDNPLRATVADVRFDTAPPETDTAARDVPPADRVRLEAGRARPRLRQPAARHGDEARTHPG